MHLFYLVFLTSLVFSFRAVSSIGIGVMLLAGFFMNPSVRQTFFQNKSRNLFLAGCALYFLLQVIAMLYTDNRIQGWANARMKAGMALVPIAVCLSLPGIASGKKLVEHFCLILLAATLYCLFISFLEFRQTSNISVFFYHELSRPIRQHAVYLSVVIIIGLSFLLESLAKNDVLFNRTFTICLAVFFSGFILLLSSKFVIGFYLAYLIYYFFKVLQKGKGKGVAIGAVFILFLATTGLVVTTKNPIRERFSDIFKGNLSVITQDSFDQGDYFNGLQFRLLQWRFITEILNENNAWWLGVGPSDAQTILNAKYISKNMYAGDPVRGDSGYLVYNTHNQFLETLLQNGIVGLLAVLLICFSMVRMMIRSKQRLVVFSILLLLGWLLIEAAFETQYGIMIFTFFALFVSHEEGKVLTPTEKPTF